MNADPVLLYLEADDEITAVVRRLRAVDTESVVLVTPGRSRATSSAVALRLLARAGAAEGRRLAVVGDALTRSLAAEAGLAAYGSVEEARSGAPAAPQPAPAAYAAIHIVRGPAADETVAVPARSHVADETRPVPTAGPRPAPRPGPRPSPRRPSALPLAAVLAAAAAILLGAAFAAAAILPAATIRVVPRTEPVGPVTYRLPIADAERIAGTVEATVPVMATGTYTVQQAATGTVVFFNWNTVAVEVPAGTLVAAGEQAFETAETITVPAGDLTNDGRIRAGEGAVGVTAAAVGPAANVPASAIDEVLSQRTAQRLRGFPRNPERLVENPEPTVGGAEGTGPEFTQADLDAALAALRDELETQRAAALDGADGELAADPADQPDPVVSGDEGLVGTRDQEQAEISGELAYDRLVVDRETVERLAEDRFHADASAVPDGAELLVDRTRVELGAAARDGDGLVVEVTVRGRAAPIVDVGEIRRRAAGLTPAEARAALADLGAVKIELWPGWVTTVPEADWRVSVEVVGGDEPAPGPSGS